MTRCNGIIRPAVAARQCALNVSAFLTTLVTASGSPWFPCAGSDDEEDFTPRDAEGNELAVDLEPNALTAAQLQEELTKRGLDVKWQPLKGKKVLVERLQVC